MLVHLIQLSRAAVAALAFLVALSSSAISLAETSVSPPVATTKLSPSPSMDGFELIGAAVAVHGSWLVTGAPGEGFAIVYRREAAGWVAYQELVPGDAGLPDAADDFGSSVAIHEDLIVVGGYATSEASTPSMGGAYVFRFDGELWVEEAKLVPNGVLVEDLEYGVSVSVSNGIAAVGSTPSSAQGAGAVFVFARNGGAWPHVDTLDQPAGTAGQDFGTALAQQGYRMAVGSPDKDGAVPGSVFIYEPTPVSWALAQELQSPNTSVERRFGWSLAMDGDTLLAANSVEDSQERPATGVVRAFRRVGGIWEHDAALEAVGLDQNPVSNFGSSVRVHGDIAVVGAAIDDDAAVNAGVVSLWVRTAGVRAGGASLVYCGVFKMTAERIEAGIGPP